MIVKVIKMPKGISEKIVKKCCSFFEEKENFLAVENVSGIWQITIGFNKESDYLAYMTEKISPLSITPILKE